MNLTKSLRSHGLFFMLALTQLAVGVAMAADTPRPGGVLKIALRGDPPTLDCHAISSSHVSFVLFPAYSSLLKFDAARYPAIVGDLATAWSVSPDGLIYTFKLRPNVRFHDGSPMTAQDVKATFERIRNPPPGVVSLRQSQMADVKSVDVPDPLTVRFTLSTRNASMLSMFANPWNCIYSAARLAQDPQYPARTIMGTGPFKLVEQSPGNRIVLNRFDGYFRKGLPYLDRLELIVLSNAAVVPALSGGQVDADFFTFSDPLKDQIIRARGARTVFSTAETTTQAILTFNARRSAFNDQRIRKALTMAIDRPGADLNLAKLVAVKGISPVYPAGAEYALTPAQLAARPGFGPDINKARDEARRLLREAGASDLKVTLLAPNTRDPYEAYAILLADNWRRIGVNVEVRAIDAAAYQAAKTARDFDVVLEWNSSQGQDPIEVLDKYVPGSAANFGGNQDKELVDLFQQIKRETNPQQVRALTQRFQIRLLDQAWSAPLLWATRTTAVPAGLHGWKTPPTFSLGLDHAELWWDAGAEK